MDFQSDLQQFRRSLEVVDKFVGKLQGCKSFLVNALFEGVGTSFLVSLPKINPSAPYPVNDQGSHEIYPGAVVALGVRSDDDAVFLIGSFSDEFGNPVNDLRNREDPVGRAVKSFNFLDLSD